MSVSNTGPVIPPDEVERLFQPFQRLGAERVRRPQRRQPGRGQRAGAGRGGAGRHGLGLAIVRAIADAHGAAVTARARPDGGLDIEVTFGPA